MTPRRYLFRANACAFGGRILRPRPVVLVSGASSSIGVSGGRAEARARATHFKPYVRIGGASTRVEAKFDDLKAARALTEGVGQEAALATTSSAQAVVDGLLVSKRLAIRQVRASLISRSAPEQGEPDIIVGRDTAIKGLTIDGFPVTVELAVAAFATMATHAAFVKAGAPGCQVPPDDTDPSKPVLATIVRSLRWTRKPHPEATIEGHVIRVPDFGRIYVGEIYITPDSRRLTLLRLRLGSPEGGMADFAEVETNGGWYPPVG
ncbi:MAG: hypothetical protein R2752_15035 [Vicinamibacterales bacterium]